MPNIGVQVVNVTFRNVVGTVVPPPTTAASTSAFLGQAEQITTTTATAVGLKQSRDTDLKFAEGSYSTLPVTVTQRTQGDPTFLTDAAGTFVCFRNRPCSVVLDGVHVTHAIAATHSPPAWLCGNTTVVVGSAGVAPPLSGGC